MKPTSEQKENWILVQEHLGEFINQLLNSYTRTEMDKDQLGGLLLTAKERPMKEFVADAILLKFLLTWCDLT